MTPWVTECPDPALWSARLDAYSREDENGCIIWTSTLDPHGYGRFRWSENGKQRMMSAARAAWLARRGPIPHGHVPDHLCRVRACVNVEHLEIVTLQENSRRGKLGRPRATGSHYPCGHPRTDENSIRRGAHPSTGTVYRSCKTCNREKAKVANARRRERLRAS